MSRSDLPGRGTEENPPNRYEPLHVELDPDDGEDAFGPASLPTTLYRDTSRTILAENDSPDVGVPVSLNPYLACGHGCSDSDARRTHEYPGFSAGPRVERRSHSEE